LIEALDDDDEGVQNNALVALGNIGGGPDMLVSLFIPFLEHPHFITRENACSALGKFGTNASAAIPALQAVAANDSYESVRQRATAALSKIDPPPQSD
jgi:HEAT repeat protein